MLARMEFSSRALLATTSPDLFCAAEVEKKKSRSKPRARIRQTSARADFFPVSPGCGQGEEHESTGMERPLHTRGNAPHQKNQTSPCDSGASTKTHGDA